MWLGGGRDGGKVIFVEAGRELEGGPGGLLVGGDAEVAPDQLAELGAAASPLILHLASREFCICVHGD